jgi:hypothetical protein
MEFSRLLLVCLLVAMWAVLAAADVPVSPRPGCPRIAKCGDIDVPYPFALEPGCTITKQFQLNCTTTAGGRKLLFHDDGHGNKLEVIDINVTENKVRFKTSISRQCYNYNQSTKTMISDAARTNITGTPYVLSRKDNKVIVLGCKNLAYMLSRTVISNLNISLHSKHITNS